jgi:hypothetical protein
MRAVLLIEPCIVGQRVDEARCTAEPIARERVRPEPASVHDDHGVVGDRTRNPRDRETVARDDGRVGCVAIGGGGVVRERIGSAGIAGIRPVRSGAVAGGITACGEENREGKKGEARDGHARTYAKRVPSRAIENHARFTKSR